MSKDLNGSNGTNMIPHTEPDDLVITEEQSKDLKQDSKDFIEIPYNAHTHKLFIGKIETLSKQLAELRAFRLADYDDLNKRITGLEEKLGSMGPLKHEISNMPQHDDIKPPLGEFKKWSQQVSQKGTHYAWTEDPEIFTLVTGKYGAETLLKGFVEGFKIFSTIPNRINYFKPRKWEKK